MPHHIIATDLQSLLTCDRQVYLDHHGDPSLRLAPDGYQVWLREQGRKHEAEVVSTFAVEKPPYTYDNLEIGFEITLGFMREGVKMIYQGVLMDDDLVGIPDLLERVSGPSSLGEWYYRPLDIKASSTPSVGHRLQVMAYCALLGAIQGVRPDGKLLLRYPPDERVEGNLYREEPVEFDEELFDRTLGEARELVDGREPRPFMSSTCTTCAWREVCTPIVEQAGDISLIPGLRRDVWRTLHTRGLGTLSALAESSADDVIDIKGLGAKTALQVIVRAKSLARGEVIALARPDLPPGDCIVFDVESAPSEGVFYLMGTLVGDAYEADVAESPQDEGHMWWNFLRRIGGLDGPIVHYGGYERQTIGRLVERHGGGDEAADLLDRMVDLEKVLKECAVLPLRSYSLKTVAPWMGFSWGSEVEGGTDSVLEYLGWLEDGDRSHLDRILHYNAEDCRATRHVLGWLHRLNLPGE